MPEKKNIIMLKKTIVFSHFVIYQQMKLFINQIKQTSKNPKQTVKWSTWRDREMEQQKYLTFTQSNTALF